MLLIINYCFVLRYYFSLIHSFIIHGCCCLVSFGFVCFVCFVCFVWFGLVLVYLFFKKIIYFSQFFR